MKLLHYALFRGQIKYRSEPPMHGACDRAINVSEQRIEANASPETSPFCGRVLGVSGQRSVSLHFAVSGYILME